MIKQMTHKPIAQIVTEPERGCEMEKHVWRDAGRDALGDKDFVCSVCGVYASQIPIDEIASKSCSGVYSGEKLTKRE